MSSTTTLSELAEQISASTQKITSFLNERNLQLSFQPDAPAAIPMVPETASYHIARLELLAATRTLENLVNGPRDTLLELALSHHTSATLRVIYEYKIAEAVPLTGSTTYTGIAESVSLASTTLQRILQYAMSIRIFQQPSPGHVSHTGMSAQLLDPGMSALIGSCLNDSYRSAVHLTEALQKWGGGSQEPDETPFQILNGSKKTFMQYLTENPEKGQRIALAMGMLSKLEPYDVQWLFGMYDWAGLGDATIVDVGGSQGHVSIALARAYPSLSFIVQDTPETISASHSSFPPELIPRFSLLGHDFFTPQSQPPTPSQKTVYFLRSVLHDWSDKYAAKILQGILPVMKKGDRILVNERVLPEPGTTNVVLEKLGRASDMQMLAIANGQERSEEQWRKLFKTVDERLEVLNVFESPGSALGLIEVGMNE